MKRRRRGAEREGPAGRPDDGVGVGISEADFWEHL